MRNTWDSIDTMPVGVWFKIHETGDYTLMLQRPKKVSFIALDYLEKKWDEVYEQYIVKFGFSDEILAIHNKRKEIAMYQLRYINGDLGAKTFIEICREELAAMNSKSMGSDFYSVKSIIERSRGHRINPNEVTVIEFYTYLRELKKIKSAA